MGDKLDDMLHWDLNITSSKLDATRIVARNMCEEDTMTPRICMNGQPCKRNCEPGTRCVRFIEDDNFPYEDTMTTPDNPLERRLYATKLFLDFWFSPWGAAKGAQWESLSKDKAFTPNRALGMAQELLRGDFDLSERVMKTLEEKK